jgi:hypothetical protein
MLLYSLYGNFFRFVFFYYFIWLKKEILPRKTQAG